MSPLELYIVNNPGLTAGELSRAFPERSYAAVIQSLGRMVRGGVISRMGCSHKGEYFPRLHQYKLLKTYGQKALSIKNDMADRCLSETVR